MINLIEVRNFDEIVQNLINAIHDKVPEADSKEGTFIRDVLAKTDNRIIATVFPAHYYRIQEIFNEVSKTHRKVVVM